MMPPLRTVAAALALAILTAACNSKVDNRQHVAGIRKVVESTPAWVEGSEVGRRLWQIERQFYEARVHAGVGGRRAARRRR